MKKIKFLFLLLVSTLVLSSQNLLKNPSFDDWTDSKPNEWSIGTTGNVTQSPLVFSENGSSIQVEATGTYNITQIVVAPDGVFDTNKKYKIVVNYKTTSGDGTDARVWCNWITSDVGDNIKYWSMLPVDSLGLKGPGGNNQPKEGDGENGYLKSNKDTGNWETYEFSFYPPTNAKQFSFQIRTYKAATVIWDDLYFGEDFILSLNDSKYDDYVSVENNVLKINKLTENTKIDIFNISGKNVLSQYTDNGLINLSGFSKGVYVIKYNDRKIKFVL